MQSAKFIAGVAAFLLASVAHADNEVYYMNIPGISGDVTARGYAGWITVTSFAEGFSSSDTENGTGAGSSRASCQEFKIVKPLDVTSPQIALAVVKGQVFSPIQIAVVHLGEVPFQYLTFTLTNAIIAAVHFGGDAATSARVETLKITPAKVKISFVPQDATGAPGVPVQSNVDCSRS
jgi:type VI secretion system secreted protein Hcp